MSALSLFQGGVVPAYLTAGLDETSKSLMGSGPLGKRISIRGSVFRMMSGAEEVGVNEDRAMNIVIIAASPEVGRTFYEGTYTEGVVASPVCWSTDGKTPSPLSENRQSPTCALCPQNIKGSGQGDSRACRFSRNLAVMLEGDLDGDVFQLSLPSMSIFGKGEGDKLPLEAYARYLGSHNVPITGVVTEMRFDTKSAVPKLTFRAVRALGESEWEKCRLKGESDDAKNAIKHEFSPVKKQGSVEDKIAETAKKQEVGEVTEPVKVSSKKTSTAPVAKDIAEQLDNWEE